MTEQRNWRSNGVRVVRDTSLRGGLLAKGRANAINFVGSGGRQPWIGVVSLPPRFQNGAHHHGRHEVAIYVVKGRSQIRWGERLEFAVDIGQGDFVYFPPFVPHQEINTDTSDALEFVVVRSDDEKIAVDLDVVPVKDPELMA